MAKEKWFFKLKGSSKGSVYHVLNTDDLLRKIKGRLGHNYVSMTSSATKENHWNIWSFKKYVGFCSKINK